jgi:hypothetical protein
MQVLTNADDDDDGWEDEATLNERRLLSRYGVWLLVSFNKRSTRSIRTTSKLTKRSNRLT